MVIILLTYPQNLLIT